MEPIRIDADMDGIRIDSFLAQRLPGLSRSGVQRLIDGGFIILGGKPVRKNHKVVRGEIFNVTLPEPVKPEAQAQEIPLDIVYEDDDLIVVNKPRGMVVRRQPVRYRRRAAARNRP